MNSIGKKKKELTTETSAGRWENLIAKDELDDELGYD
jgi:hypothetical protein